MVNSYLTWGGLECLQQTQTPKSNIPNYNATYSDDKIIYTWHVTVKKFLVGDWVKK